MSNKAFEPSPQIEKLLKEASEEMGSYFENFKSESEQHQKKLADFNEKVYANIRQNCSQQVDWLEANSQNASEAERDVKYKEFEQCAVMNDFGIRTFFEEIEKDDAKMQGADSKCVEQCVNKKNDLEIKDCFKKCMRDVTGQYKIIMDKIDTKIDSYKL